MTPIEALTELANVTLELTLAFPELATLENQEAAMRGQAWEAEMNSGQTLTYADRASANFARACSEEVRTVRGKIAALEAKRDYLMFYVQHAQAIVPVPYPSPVTVVN
jgi:hypothetical protein